MADDLGQLWAELMMQNNVSPQLKQIIEDLKLADGSIRKTREELERFSDVKLTDGMTDVEKNWRNMRGAISDVQKEINKVTGKMAEMNSLGLGDTVQYNKYKDILLRLIGLKKELTDSSSRSTILGSEDISRFKSEFQLASKEISNTDAQSKRLVETQKQNISAVEKMVEMYDKMATSLANARKGANDSGMTPQDTFFAESTIRNIRQAMDVLRGALSDPSSLTSKMVQGFMTTFDQISQKAKATGDRLRTEMDARKLIVNGAASLSDMEVKLERIKNKLQEIRSNKSITVNTSGLEKAQQELSQFVEKYRTKLSSGSISKGEATQLAETLRQLYKNAEIAEAKLNRMVSAQARASSSARQAASAYDPIIQKMQQLQSATTRTGRIWDQFKTQIAFTAFSVYGIEHFLKSVITVGGEFERQRVALQNMLGDMREASEIFGQLKNLALQSPFTFRQLSTYTKQLAAFSIPYEELYDTNRRLSDMSAGLGVDMSRLILAYGQVRAATVLRGQELRQFTEAGVPMVEKLADYFTKLNGQLVTTKDIFAMISKKQVPFEAVRTVIQEMTDEGGMFYNMQAKIADTLSGRWGNLKDAWEIMLGTLADSESIMGKSLKWLVELLTSVIRHLTTVAGLVGGLGVGRLLRSLGVFTATSFGSTGSSTDVLFKRSKSQYAIELQRAALGRKLSQTELDILATKNQITTVDRMTMLRTGQIDKYQAAILLKSTSLSKTELMRAALASGMTKEQIRQLATEMQQLSVETKRSLVWQRMKAQVGNFFGGMNWAGIGWTVGLMAVMGIVGHLVQKYNELREAKKTAEEELSSTNSNLYDFLVTNKPKDKMSDEEARRFIEKYDAELKKVAPNYIEIKSRIVGEHGESPQEQAEAYYKALQDAMDAAYMASEKGTSGRIIEKFDLAGFTTGGDVLNKEAQGVKELSGAIAGLTPQKFDEVAEGMVKMDQISKSTKESISALVKEGKKVEALKLLSDESGMSLYQLSRGMYFGLPDQVVDSQVKDLVENVVKQIRSEWSEYFDGDKFDENNEMADKAKSGIEQVLRNAASTQGLDSKAAESFYSMVQDQLFGYSENAMDRLVTQFTKKYADQKDAIAAALKNGNLPDSIKDQLQHEADLIGFIDYRFSEQIDNILSHEKEIVRNILLRFDVETDISPWQQKLIEDFGEQYAATIKAQPDIPSALEAITKLYKESKEKVETLKPLMLKMGISFNGNKLPDKAPLTLKPEYQSMYNDLKNQVNPLVETMSGWSSSKDKYGLKEPKLKGDKSKKTGGGKKEDKELQSWQRHVELYKKFLDQYRELTKMFGEKEALDRLRKSSAYTWVMDFAKGRNLSVTDIDAMNAALSGSLDVNKGDKQKRKDAIAKRQADLEAEGYKREGEELKRLNDTLNEHLKILNDQYDAYQKIYRITGDKQGAMLLAFGDKVSNQRYIDELTDQLEKALKKEGSKLSIDQALGLTKEQVNDTFGEESVAANLINKLKEERNKLEKEYIDILANALTADMSLEDKRAEAVRKHNEAIEKLIELREKESSLEAKAAAQEAINAENNAKRRTETGYDQQIYERDMNLGSLINNASMLSEGMIQGILVRLRGFRASYANDQTPEAIQAMQKLDEQIAKLTDTLKERDLASLFKEAFSNKNDDVYQGSDGKWRIKGTTATRYGFNQEQEIDQNVAENIKATEKMRKLSVAIGAAEKAFKDIESILKPVIDLFDALGQEDTPLGKGLQIGSNALSAASSTAGAFSNLAQAAGPDSGLGKLLGNAGPYGAAAAAALSVATTIFQLHDKALQKEIEASEARQKEMENLANNLEAILERTLGDIYAARMDDKTRQRYDTIVSGRESLQGNKLGFWDWIKAQKEYAHYTKETIQAMREALSSGSYYDSEYAALRAQRDEMQKQLDLEKKKKKSDDSVIKDLEQKLIEADDKIKYYAIDMAKELYSIDIKSWSESLADAIIDAWAKGEDAVEAYKNKVNDIMRDIVKNIVAKKFIQDALERANLEGIIKDEMDTKDGKLDEFSVKKIGDALMTASDSAISNTTKLLEYLKSVGYDLSDTADNASTLGKGIASITEDTADLLASYINAIRADVAAIRAIEERVLETGFLDVNTNLALQLTELRNISSFAERNAMAAERILDLFESVTTIGGSGRKVRV